MKKMFITIWFLCLGAFLYAQSTTIYCFMPHVVAVKTVYNTKNEIVSRLEYTMFDVKYEHGGRIAQGKTAKFKNNKETEMIIGKFLYDGTRLLISMGKMTDRKDAWLDHTPGMMLEKSVISYDKKRLLQVRSQLCLQ